MSLGRRCAQEEDIPGRRHPQQGDIAGKVSSTGSCPWEEDVSGKIASPGRRHPPQGCPWEGVIHREVSLEKCQEEDVPGKM